MARIEFKEIRLFFLRNGYLLIIAAWLLTFSFLFANFWSYYSSEDGVRQTLQSSINAGSAHSTAWRPIRSSYAG
ncbi:hypothetical protein MKQ70_01755 [Chitinophaga sedimenti]|uniref:hypothetical protein n=1 Tax=Chitinophaga sedimenti TaxID=2033606 RepID=UPI002004214D|nr:hypothetical protein [Chitinophaga sedimenti]MCK7553795.1 hypothetical protein [Chitinophaga sedimenti]